MNKTRPALGAKVEPVCKAPTSLNSIRVQPALKLVYTAELIRLPSCPRPFSKSRRTTPLYGRPATGRGAMLGYDPRGALLCEPINVTAQLQRERNYHFNTLVDMLEVMSGWRHKLTVR